MALTAALVLLGACSVAEERPGVVAVVEGFAGLVAADEPRAAVIGRDVLGRNGTAADAAVAMGFAMTASYPSRVGLGGGGVCVVYDGPNLAGTSIAFLPETGPDGAVAPMLARGLALLHARFGSLRWELLVSPAENLARQGNPVSRALQRDIEAAAPRLAEDPRLAAAFLPGGRPPEVGDRILLPELAGALSGLRGRGVAYAVGGPYAQRLVAAARAEGMALTPERLRDSLAQVEPAREVPLGNDVVMLPADAAIGPRLAALRQGTAAPGAGPAGETAPAAGFVVADRFGYAVACSFTQNGLFGAARALGDTGVLLPGRPPAGGYAGVSAVGLVANKNIVRVRHGVAASGHDAGAAFDEVLRRLADGDETAAGAVAAPRRDPAAEGARVNAFRCPQGTVAGAGVGCAAAADPRGAGLAEIAN